MRRIRTGLPIVVAIALIGGATAPLTAFRVPGWTITMRMSIDSGGGRAPTTISMKLSGSGQKVRQEMVMPGMPPVASIMDRSDSTITVVMEQMGMAMIMRTPSTLAGIGGSTHTNVKTSTADLGAGEALNGSPTTRRRMTLTSTITQTLGSVTCSRPQTQEIEVWLSADPVLPKVMTEFMAAMPKLQTPGADPRELLRLAGLDLNAQAVVRAVTREVGIAAVTMTMEYSDYALIDVDPAKLAAPAGLQVQDMRGMDMSAMMGNAMGQVGDRMFWSTFDTTAAAGAARASCARK